jgi:hypothetical protein
LGKAQKLFSVGIPLYDDWIYESSYNNIDHRSLHKIPIDVENTLLLLRLFKVGDLSFIKHCIKEPDDNMLRQFPYRVMSDIHPFREYEIQNYECAEFDKFH